MQFLGSIVPFNLPGPAFLAFFIGLAAILLVGLRQAIRTAEAGPQRKLDLKDPYQIAFLRGGAKEAVTVTTFALIDRGLLLFNAGQARVASAQATQIVRRPLERRVLNHFASLRDVKSVEESSVIDTAIAEYTPKLEQLGFVPDAAARQARRMRALFVAVVLLAVAGIKLVVALLAGRHNVWFLIIATAIAVLLAWLITRPRLTSRGRSAMDDLRNLFRGLMLRASQIRPGGGNADAVMAAAVFGLGALPLGTFPFITDLQPKPVSSSGDSGGGGCGSSSGCGGGGGCGGCGS